MSKLFCASRSLAAVLQRFHLPKPIILLAALQVNDRSMLFGRFMYLES